MIIAITLAVTMAIVAFSLSLAKKKDREKQVYSSTINCDNPDWEYYMNRAGNEGLIAAYGHAKGLNLHEDLRQHWESYGHKDRPLRGPCR